MNNMTAMLNLMMAAPREDGAGAGGGMGMLVPMLLIFGVFYFMLIRPQQRRERERRQMVESLRSGQRIVFAGGLLGTITEVREGTLRVKLADNVELEAARGSVTRVLQEDEKPGTEEQR